MRYSFAPTRMAIILKKKRKLTCWWGDREIGALVDCYWRCEMVQLLWETVWSFLKRLNIELPYDPAIRLLDTYPKNWKQKLEQIFVHFNVHSCFIHNSLKVETTKASSRWMGKRNLVSTCNGMLFSHKKEWGLHAYYKMDGPWNIMLSEISHTRERYSWSPLIYSTKNRQIHREGR